jgi:hypothetical protein
MAKAKSGGRVAAKKKLSVKRTPLKGVPKAGADTPRARKVGRSRERPWTQEK